MSKLIYICITLRADIYICVHVSACSSGGHTQMLGQGEVFLTANNVSVLKKMQSNNTSSMFHRRNNK